MKLLKTLLVFSSMTLAAACGYSEPNTAVIEGTSTQRLGDPGVAPGGGHGPKDPNHGGGGGGGGQQCGAPAVEGQLAKGGPVCIEQRQVSARVTGDFGKAITVGITGPNGYAANGTARRSGKSCGYNFKWRFTDATAGDYTFDVTGVNGTTFSFNATLSGDAAACEPDDDEGTTTGSGGTTGAGTTGGGTGDTTGGTGGTTTGGASLGR